MRTTLLMVITRLHRYLCRHLHWRLPLIAAAAVVSTERERAAFVHLVGRGSSWFWRLVHALPSLPTGPSHAAAGLLIRLTVTAGTCMHSVLRSVRQQHGLLRLHTAYIVCQKCHARSGAGPKKDPRPVRSILGPAQSRTGNWTGSNSIFV